MPKDRLTEFRRAAAITSVDVDEDNNAGETVALQSDGVSANHTTGHSSIKRSRRSSKTVIVVDPPDAKTGPALNEFFKQLEAVQTLITNLRAKVDEVKAKHLLIIAAPQADDRMKEQLDQLMADIRKLSTEIRLQLKIIEQSSEADTTMAKGGAEWRIRRTQYGTTLARFNETMNLYHSCQVEYRESCKDRIRRGLQITGNTMTEQELDDALESGDPSVFTQGILIQTAQARQSLKDIEARHNDIIKLENSIRELKDMFTDIVMLVESQGEMIDSIERSVEQAKDYTESAKEQTAKGLTYQGKARKKKIILIICLIVALIVIALIIGLSVALR